MTIESPLPGGTVLVVDDAPESLRFLTDTLESVGIPVLIATSGEAALELLHYVVPDLILMDAVMPGLDGFETTRKIKQDARHTRLPVMFMTGLTESEHVVRALEAGGVDYVRKPIDVDELIARVRVHMTNARVTEGSQLALDVSGRNLIAVTEAERIAWCTPGAEDILLQLSPSWSRDKSAMPDPVKGAVARLIGKSARPGFVARIDLPDDVTVELVLVARQRSNDALIRLNYVDPAISLIKLQEQLGLTVREAEVLLWVSYGKPNRVISEILTISPRTVNKHLEQVFEKIGVETRSAAAAMAVRVIGQ